MCFSSQADCQASTATPCGFFGDACAYDPTFCNTGINIGTGFSYACKYDYTYPYTGVNATFNLLENTKPAAITNIAQLPNAAGLPCYTSQATCEADLLNPCGSVTAGSCTVYPKECAHGVSNYESATTQATTLISTFTYTCEALVPPGVHKMK